MTEVRCAVWGGAAWTSAGGRSGRRTPHLASPPGRGEECIGEGEGGTGMAMSVTHQCLRTPHQTTPPKKMHPSALEGGRDELGKGREGGTGMAMSVTHQCLRTRAPSNSPKKMHPSPLSGGRLGGGWKATSQRHPPACAPSAHPTIPACAGMTEEESVIPAQAGTHPNTPTNTPKATPPRKCIPPPFQGGG